MGKMVRAHENMQKNMQHFLQKSPSSPTSSSLAVLFLYVWGRGSFSGADPIKEHSEKKPIALLNYTKKASVINISNAYY